ncbi:germin-like protein subfamily 3 member 2 [Amaranthus tricolor]|uniref:germin-like protein subfamily 3 member 2 n=1 Tax=Amaranthus tricolor TaxID=29722 RepID=UPI00258C46F0|nr:germin-like protein subfamily 3 member 2 [Amaranthus tricolor]
MSLPLIIVLLLSLQYQTIFTSGSDPDPTQDFCIGSEPGSPTCKNTDVTVEDFIFTGIKFPGNFTNTGFTSKPVNANVFPGLNTLGLSMVRADFDLNGINVPHYHPRATEIAYVLEGKIYSGFVDTQGKLYARVLEKGEVMVFPRGLLHFQMNVGDSPAAILGSFDSQNPGLMKIPSSIFGSNIKEELLQKAFGLSARELHRLKNKFTST